MGIANQGEPSNRVALSISLKRPSNQNESLHHPSMCRSRLRWRRYVWHEEDAKNMGRTQSYGIMLRRKRDEDIFAQNEEGSCKVYRDGHAKLNFQCTTTHIDSSMLFLKAPRISKQ